MKQILISLLFILAPLSISAQRETISLDGTWRFQADPMGFGKTPGSELYLKKLSETIHLPGTTDEGGKGIATTSRYIDRLTRKFEYLGQAWYQREIIIPKDWENKDITLVLERCHWETTVYLDNKEIGSEEHLSTPNRFELSDIATPGLHTLTICVDNTLKYPMDQWTHGTTEYTQTNWNGIVGDIKLVARNKCHIDKIKTYPNIKNNSVRFDITLKSRDSLANPPKIHIVTKDSQGNIVGNTTITPTINKGNQNIQHNMKLTGEPQLWNEFTPNIYTTTISLESDSGSDTQTTTFGMREVAADQHHIQLNGRNIHLRGTLDCCVFPKTGYPSTTTNQWKKIFTTIKDHGMNHVRFHSWCPPEAAFTAADEVGIYLQVELPMWIKDVGKHPARRDFFEKELYAVLDEYGNHPSFLLMCNGNENEGDFSVLEDLVKKGQAHDNRHLYSASTARTHTPSDQYYVSHVTAKGGITVYEGIPSTNWDKRKESDIDCPVIAHESGQRCMYPNFDEMKKYTGILEPRNFEVFRERLTRNGMAEQARDFFEATGAHTVLQYKEVNESLLRTPNSGGFQLLGLSDFPGQGSAFVGILDAFWESKGLVSPEKFRESCGPTVLLARLPKRAFTNNETLKAKLEIYHYDQFPIKKGELTWQLADNTGNVIAQGKANIKNVDCATVDSITTLNINLDKIQKADKLTLHATLNKTIHNEWNIWVYPSKNKTIDLFAKPEDRKEPSRDSLTRTKNNNHHNFEVATQLDKKVQTLLEEGKNVLLIPQTKIGRKTHFASHFWNPIMFNWNPMIVGTLIHKDHPAFNNFPTDKYADWQWWDILNNAWALDLTELRRLTPIIQSIDTYEHNRKLGIAFECRVANGNLFVLNLDTEKNLSERPATQQLLTSIIEYLDSKAFCPQTTLQFHQLENLFANKTSENNNTSNAIQQLLNQ